MSAAGGLGIAPAMSILQDLERAAARVPTLFIWSCRQAAELEYLAPPALAMLEALPDVAVTSKLFLTGGWPRGACTLRVAARACTHLRSGLDRVLAGLSAQRAYACAHLCACTSSPCICSMT